MKHTRYPIKKYEELSQAFWVALEDHYTLTLTGSLHRRYRTGFVLRKLVKEGKLLSGWWGRHKMYSCKRRHRFQDEIPLVKVPHGLTCTEILVRLYLSRFGVMLSDADFSGQSFIPDGGIRYPDKSLLVFEYSTKDNFSRRKLIEVKLDNYLDHASETVVLFVIEDKRQKVEDFVRAHPCPIWFCDLDTFLTPAYHEQLQSPIYIWGGSGETHPIIAR